MDQRDAICSKESACAVGRNDRKDTGRRNIFVNQASKCDSLYSLTVGYITAKNPASYLLFDKRPHAKTVLRYFTVNLPCLARARLHHCPGHDRLGHDRLRSARHRRLVPRRQGCCGVEPQHTSPAHQWRRCGKPSRSALQPSPPEKQRFTPGIGAGSAASKPLSQHPGVPMRSFVPGTTAHEWGETYNF